jgi:hypothetical protein
MGCCAARVEKSKKQEEFIEIDLNKKSDLK